MLLSIGEAYEIIEANKYAVISLIDADGLPYGVTLDYIHKGDRLYSHGDQEDGAILKW